MNPDQKSEGALGGLRVIEVCQNLAGPYCCTLLADMGADVVKVEPPGGDHSRHIGRHFAGGESYAFMTLNRSKRSIVIDLKTDGGKSLLKEMAAGGGGLKFRRLGLLEGEAGACLNAKIPPAQLFLHAGYFTLQSI